MVEGHLRLHETHDSPLTTGVRANEPRVQELLDEILDSERTPDEVCGACPELLPEIRKRWHQMRVVEAELEALFPTQGPDPDSETPAPRHAGAALPRMPGYRL